MDTNDEYYASMLMVMVRDAEAYVTTFIDEEDHADMQLTMDELFGGA